MKKLPVEKQTSVRNSVLRVFIFGITALLQLVWILVFFGALRANTPELSSILQSGAVLMALWIYGKDQNTTKQIPWMMLMLIFPLVGVVLYILFGRSSLLNKARVRFSSIDAQIKPLLVQDLKTFEQLKEQSKTIANHSLMIHNTAGYPVYSDTKVQYYPQAVDAYQAQIEQMKKAKHFIFMEYHAIEDGESFSKMKHVLIEKANQGVDVRIVYDDMGSAIFIDRDFIKKMEQAGIQCRMFNPIRPFLLVFMNNRDHRKITVIDGQVAFTGGYNIANEYFNVTHPYGFWKDTGVRLEGLAVNSLTATFLEMWNSLGRSDTDYSRYLLAQPVQSKGFIQPYADSPLDDEYLGENVYMNIVNAAIDYVYFCTPYLILTDEMKRVLGLAAKRGVDVRIITPGIPDKKLTYQITRSHYYELVKQGVKIYEFTPGFVHAKMCISDDQVATVGTINMDYRSLFLNFENGVYLYDCPVINHIKTDFDQMFSVSNNVTEDYTKELSMPVRTWKAILRLVSPLF